LAGLGAGVEMVPTDRHPGQIPGRLRQGHRVYDPGDIMAAVADIKTDAEFVTHKIYLFRLFPFSPLFY
jgi:hypothetical protein